MDSIESDMFCSMKVLDSRHYNWEQLADGVLAAIMKEEGSHASSNAGIIDLGDQTIVFDSSNSPAAGRDLLATARLYTGCEPAYLINSHYHGDHVRGNQVFGAKTQIVSTVETAVLMKDRGIPQLAQQKETLPQQFAAQEARLAAASDENEIALLQGMLAFYRPTVAALPELETRLPTLTFAQQMNFVGTKRTAQLITYGGAHTASDAFLYLPDCGVVFVADLLFLGFHPFLADGDPDNLPPMLDKIKQLDADKYVSGHGGVGTEADLIFMQNYVEKVKATAIDYAQTGVSLEDAVAHPVIDEFKGMMNLAGMYQSSIRYFYEQHA